MNYAYLLKKYHGVDNCIVHDRTYEGLEMPGGLRKPSMETFEAWQEYEDQLARQGQRRVEDRHSQVELRQQAARVKALEEIRPFEDKLREIELAVAEEAKALKKGALECQSILRTRGEVVSAWTEITHAQDLLNKEAQRYLDDTVFVLSWDHTDVPAEIAEKRRIAQQRLKSGQTVFREWASLRSLEAPSRAEIEEAVRLGGEHLDRIRKTCKEIALRYPRPRVTADFNNLKRDRRE